MKIKRGLLLSGGGSWGAYGGGTLARLNNDYDTVVGISTGSLLAPFIALNEWDLLKIGYTNVTNNDIFDNFWYKSSPLFKNGKLKKIPIIISLILGQKTICTSNSLRKTIDKYFVKEYYIKLHEKNKEILIGTQNLAEIPSKIHYFSSVNENFEDMKDWMWCSANFPFFTTLVKKGWNDSTGNFHVGLWCDGGLTELVGLDQLMNKGFKEIDIILHRNKNVQKFEGNKINNLIDNISTSISAMRYDIEFEYLYTKINKLNEEGCKVTIYWLPRELSSNCMIFNEAEMTSWWDEGYNSAYNPDRIEVFNAK